MSLLWKTSDRHPVVDERDYKRFLRFPSGRALEGPLAENAAWAREWFAAHAHPWSAAILADPSVGALASSHFPEDSNLAVVAVSAGPEAEAEAAACWQADEPDRYFFLECYAAAVVEALLALPRHRLGAEKHLCPGYRGWPIADNHVLLAALRSADALAGPLAVLSSGMLVPKKSQLAVCAIRAATTTAR